MRSCVHHVGLTVSDLDRSVAFYRDNFELEEIGRHRMDGEDISRQTDLPGTVIEIALLAGENTVLELIQYVSPRGEERAAAPCDAGAAHLCFVVDDLDRKHAEMAARGVELHAPPHDFGPSKMVYLRDPDGAMVEMCEPLEGMRLEDLLAIEAS